MNMKTEESLQSKKIKVDAQIAAAAAKERGLNLDIDVVAGLIGRSVKFDRKFLTFLQQFATAGDVGEYLKNLLSKKNEISVEDEEAVSKINNAIKRGIKAFDEFQEHSDLYVHVNSTMLKNLLDKVTTLLAAIPVREE
jgi:hypothetical protein